MNHVGSKMAHPLFPLKLRLGILALLLTHDLPSALGWTRANERALASRVAQISAATLASEDPENGLFGGKLYIGKCRALRAGAITITNGLPHNSVDPTPTCTYYFVSLKPDSIIGADALKFGLNGYPRILPAASNRRHSGCIALGPSAENNLKTALLAALNDSSDPCDLRNGDSFSNITDESLTPDSLLGMKAPVAGGQQQYNASKLRVKQSGANSAYYVSWGSSGLYCAVEGLKASTTNWKRAIGAQAEVLLNLASAPPANLPSNVNESEHARLCNENQALNYARASEALDFIQGAWMLNIYTSPLTGGYQEPFSGSNQISLLRSEGVDYQPVTDAGFSTALKLGLDKDTVRACFSYPLPDTPTCIAARNINPTSTAKYTNTVGAYIFDANPNQACFSLNSFSPVFHFTCRQ